MKSRSSLSPLNSITFQCSAGGHNAAVTGPVVQVQANLPDIPYTPLSDRLNGLDGHDGALDEPDLPRMLDIVTFAMENTDPSSMLKTFSLYNTGPGYSIVTVSLTICSSFVWFNFSVSNLCVTGEARMLRDRTTDSREFSLRRYSKFGQHVQARQRPQLVV